MDREAEYEILREHIVVGLKADSKEDVVRTLVALLEASGLVADADVAVADVMGREAVRPTGLARGVACPHAKTSAASGLLVAIARLDDGIDFGALDGVPARHVFLILSPKTADGRPHIKALSSIVKCYHNPEILRRLDDAENADEYFETLKNTNACE